MPTQPPCAHPSGQPSELPLQGIRVLDLSTVISGPMATAMLADQGAAVIKVEPPGGDQSRRIGPAKGDLSAMFVSVNRGKRSIVLDLKRAAHVEVVHELLARADVLVENFRPGAMRRLGLGAETLCAAYPRLVYASITGFGADGPYAAARVYDAVIQAVSGISASHPSQSNGEPTLLATTVCDKLTALNAAQAICSALLARERSGHGTRLQIAMLDAALAFNWPDAMNNHTFVHEPPAAFPEFGIHQRPYRTRNGHVAVMTPQPEEFAALCKGLGRPGIAHDPRFSTSNARRHHVTELLPLLQSLIAGHDTDELVATLSVAGVPIGRVNEHQEVLGDPQVRHNQALVEVDHGAGVGAVRLARSAARFGGGHRVARTPGVAPHLGQHAGEVLAELGFDAPRIAALLAPAERA
jgi:crotonobetainyl-CoA:carnitine CoA-transferase CaiB-like acyl-CoA transferase